MGNQTISTTVPGPIFSNGAAITVTSTGAIDGGPTGVAAVSFSITKLSNSGSILGGFGVHTTGPGGDAVLNNKTITTLSNIGTIAGGPADFAGSTLPGGTGGVGVANGGTITTLTSSGTIRGG